MHIAFDDDLPEAVIWMQSHVKPGQCGAIARGDGFLLIELDVAMNDAADKLAKAAVEAHRAPYRFRKEVEAHDVLTTKNAMWIARATILANQQSDEPCRDTQASRARDAAAAAVKRKLKAQSQPVVLVMGVNPPREPRSKPEASRVEGTPYAEPKEDGGAPNAGPSP